MSECRPPEGTPDGAVCVLRANDGEAVIVAAWHSGTDWGEWECYTWNRLGAALVRDYRMTSLGWRFVCVATVPGDGE